MSQGNNFNRRRRGGQRFRPSGGISQPKHDKAAADARAAVTGEKPGDETVFGHRHEKEIQRAENVAAGLPPEAVTDAEADVAEKEAGGFRAPNADVQQAESAEEAGGGGGAPPNLDPPRQPGLLGAIKHVTNKIIQRVARLVRPKKKSDKDVIINAESLETRVAILEQGRLEDFTIERTNQERLVGSIFKGRVKNLEDGLKAAFVDIGFEKNAFLHYWDIVPTNLDSSVEFVDRGDGGRRREKPKVTQKDIPRVYPTGSEIIVQVTKGPIGTKGPRVTCHLALPGRYLVLLPNSDQSGISRKIESQEERHRLKKIVRALSIPDGMGVIIRTAGQGQQARYFVRDLALLLEEWKLIQDRTAKQPLATCVFEEPDLVERTVRDFLTEDVDRIIIDDSKHFERVQEMIAKISKRSIGKVKFYNEPQHVFDRFNITKQLESAFARQVMLKGGGYLVIDETEALVAIDVNTGKHKGGKDQDATIYKVNLEAAEEICRQLRLRNMGGLIVLDFIDMRSRKDQQQVYNRVRDGLRRDRAKTHILPISPLGLMEMTRQRHSESVHSAVYDDCPYCKGRGRVKSTVTMSVEIQRKIGEIMRKRGRDESDFQLRIVVNPGVYERLRKEDEKLLIEMEKKYFGKFTLRPEPALHAEQFKIVNAMTNEELASVG